jgi:hypothetical protein
VEESPVKDAVSEKLKKRSILKGLNERSNPSSPRKEHAGVEPTTEAPTTLLAAARKLEMEELEEAAEVAGDVAAAAALHALGLEDSVPTELAAVPVTEQEAHSSAEVAVDAAGGTAEWNEQGDAAPRAAEEIIAEMLRAAVQAALDSLSRQPSRS